ncbi:MAG TPA: hypothetical protein VJ801_15560, partial [Polyangia bacterium]|nr:hypothetical protein [Polyangia bacterium]
AAAAREPYRDMLDRLQAAHKAGAVAPVPRLPDPEDMLALPGLRVQFDGKTYAVNEETMAWAEVPKLAAAPRQRPGPRAVRNANAFDDDGGPKS